MHIPIRLERADPTFVCVCFIHHSTSCLFVFFVFAANALPKKEREREIVKSFFRFQKKGCRFTRNGRNWDKIERSKGATDTPARRMALRTAAYAQQIYVQVTVMWRLGTAYLMKVKMGASICHPVFDNNKCAREQSAGVRR